VIQKYLFPEAITSILLALELNQVEDENQNLEEENPEEENPEEEKYN
jgi:hypothetical protein